MMDSERKPFTKYFLAIINPIWYHYLCSGDSCEDTPVPMPNTVVKLTNAESTWLEAAREDRKPLHKMKPQS